MLSPSMVFIPEALSRTPSRSSFNWQEGVGPDNAHRQSCLQKQLCADAANGMYLLIVEPTPGPNERAVHCKSVLVNCLASDLPSRNYRN